MTSFKMLSIISLLDHKNNPLLENNRLTKLGVCMILKGYYWNHDWERKHLSASLVELTIIIHWSGGEYDDDDDDDDDN